MWEQVLVPVRLRHAADAGRLALREVLKMMLVTGCGGVCRYVTILC